MKIAIVSGKDEGPTKLNAFDNALSDAKIGDVNLIKVSSMLGKETEIIELPDLIPGDMINCVLASVCSNIKGEKITAVIAVAIGQNLGCVIENSGKNRETEEIITESIDMVKYMMDKRGEEIVELIVKEETHVVSKIGSVVSAVIYLD